MVEFLSIFSIAILAIVIYMAITLDEEYKGLIQNLKIEDSEFYKNLFKMNFEYFLSYTDTYNRSLYREMSETSSLPIDERVERYHDHRYFEHFLAKKPDVLFRYIREENPLYHLVSKVKKKRQLMNRIGLCIIFSPLLIVGFTIGVSA